MFSPLHPKISSAEVDDVGNRRKTTENWRDIDVKNGGGVMRMNKNWQFYCSVYLDVDGVGVKVATISNSEHREGRMENNWVKFDLFL